MKPGFKPLRSKCSLYRYSQATVTLNQASYAPGTDVAVFKVGLALFTLFCSQNTVRLMTASIIRVTNLRRGSNQSDTPREWQPYFTLEANCSVGQPCNAVTLDAVCAMSLTANGQKWSQGGGTVYSRRLNPVDPWRLNARAWFGDPQSLTARLVW